MKLYIVLFVIGCATSVTVAVNNELGQTLSQIATLIEKQKQVADSSEAFTQLSELKQLVLDLENEAYLDDRPGFIGTLVENTNELIEYYDSLGAGTLKEAIGLILDENFAALTTLSNGDGTLFDVTPKFEHERDVYLTALKAVYGNYF